MPSDKRQRQREGREARRQAALKAQKRAAKRRQIISLLLVVALVLGVGLLFSRGGDDEAGAKKDGDTSSTTTSEAAAGSEPGAADVECPPADGSAERRTRFPGPPPMCIDPAKSYTASVETDVGTFVIDFDEQKAPMAVNSFIFLSRYHYYDGVPFHRVIPGFVVQGGDGERGDGTGGPGYRLKDELPAAGEYRIGSVAMANSGPDTAGSQFFVVTGDQGVALPPQYTLFGTVTEGLDVVKRIEADGTQGGTPKVKHVINKVTINESDS